MTCPLSLVHTSDPKFDKLWRFCDVDFHDVSVDSIDICCPFEDGKVGTLLLPSTCLSKFVSSVLPHFFSLKE